MNLITAALSLPFLGALLLLLVQKGSSRTRGSFAAGVSLASFLLLMWGGRPVFYGTTLHYQWSWFPNLNIAASLYVDGLGLMFAGLVSGIGFLVCVYAIGYLHEPRIDALFWFSLLMFMGSMLGVVLAGDFILLLVFWELTSVTSFLLIGIHYWDKESRRSALNALFITAGGGLCLLGGLLMVAATLDSFSIPYFLAHGLGFSGWTTAAMLLVLLGCFTKSAHFPFHFWLPQAMAAPTPISAYLHSATMVKAGIYLMIRLYPGFAANPYWSPILLWTGLVTFLIGGALAVSREDAKSLLAYSTVSQLGMITFMLGIDQAAGILGALFHILAHATFKGSLFMGAGMIDHTYHSRRLDRIGPLARTMPWVSVLMGACSLSMAGVIPFSGFVSKESMFEGLLHLGSPAGRVALVGGVLGSILTFLYSMRFVFELPFGTARSEPAEPHRLPRVDWWCMALPPTLLTLGTAGLGIALWDVFPAAQYRLNKALGLVASSLQHLELHPHFKLWHGFGQPLMLTGVVFAVGLVLYLLLPAWRGFWDLLYGIGGPEDANRVFQDHLVEVCHGFMGYIIRGPLAKYLRIILLFTLVIGIWTWVAGPSSTPLLKAEWGPGWPDIRWIPFVTVILSGLGLLLLHRPVPSVIALGALGFLISTIYLVYLAPDLIMTQISVETVSIVIFLWVLKDIDFSGAPERSRRYGDLLISLGVSLGLGYVLVRSLTWKSGLSVPAQYYITHSIPEAWGHNMVNVILVDFRALDTLGEISVLSIATIGVLALLGVVFRSRQARGPEDTS